MLLRETLKHSNFKEMFGIKHKCGVAILSTLIKFPLHFVHKYIILYVVAKCGL